MVSNILRDFGRLGDSLKLTQDLTPFSFCYQSPLLKHGEHLRSDSQKENGELEHQAGLARLERIDHSATKIVPRPPMTVMAVC